MVYVEEGLEDLKDEAHQWFRRALDLSGPDGPIRQFELKDILEKQTEWNEQARRIQEGIVRGDIPLIVGILGLRTTLVDVLLRNFAPQCRACRCAAQGCYPSVLGPQTA